MTVSPFTLKYERLHAVWSPYAALKRSSQLAMEGIRRLLPHVHLRCDRVRSASGPAWPPRNPARRAAIALAADHGGGEDGVRRLPAALPHKPADRADRTNYGAHERGLFRLRLRSAVSNRFPALKQTAFPRVFNGNFDRIRVGRWDGCIRQILPAASSISRSLSLMVRS